MSECRTCGALIEWLEHEGTGKTAPIDVKPVPGGNIQVRGHLYRVVASEPFTIRRTSHFATCPDAADHRSKES